MTAKPTQVKTTTVLIVEDETLIANRLRMNLKRNGYQVMGVATSYEEAVTALRIGRPDIVLLDIRLNGPRTGVDVAKYLRAQTNAPPFIYLTSRMDEHYLELAQRTRPAACLDKPIQINSLLATLRLEAFKAASRPPEGKTIDLPEKGVKRVVRIDEIRYLESEHVYTKIKLTRNRIILQRGSLIELLEKIHSDRFVRAHRSYIVNLDQVTAHTVTSLHFGEHQVPISRSNRREILNLLD